MQIAVQGCCHGELDVIYDTAIRNTSDYASLAVPKKYLQLGDFQKYYAAKRRAPILTVLIGGNHESSGYMRELFYGGWVAPNMYYLGNSGAVTFNGLRLAGLSGIYYKSDLNLGHFEKPPYDHSTMRSAYHVRAFDVAKLSHICDKSPLDIMLSHDWPAGIEHRGNMKALLKKKKHFHDDIKNGQLGSPPAMHLLKTLKPRFWFSSHLHVKFAAIFKHKVTTKVENPDEIAIDLDDNTQVETPSAGDTTAPKEDGPRFPEETRFLALDKVLPRRDYMQILEIEPVSPIASNPSLSTNLCYDPEWLAITRVYHPYFTTSRTQPLLPQNVEELIQKERVWVAENVKDLAIPKNFEITIPPHPKELQPRHRITPVQCFLSSR
ncbi:Lariat debranching enzyme [Neolecta irregularis DAH-3]|uniref:Lariat debranching enzyme n=1 Tax=Neolecta irregularis (strain DAH-3) TaxID=1198029 RepID=A0A1U7LUQ4_NEOID|nr:Lariat debranching enzyme [Neolecta irregularis DAH-3]|eukprot:OLL26374.1 Lariat debranching enzyme [Neolecta irregularis DAH-3]